MAEQNKGKLFQSRRWTDNPFTTGETSDIKRTPAEQAEVERQVKEIREYFGLGD